MTTPTSPATRRGVAPHCQEWLRDREILPPWSDFAEEMRAELRALLAVARHAAAVDKHHRQQWNGRGARARERMRLALARLARVSERGSTVKRGDRLPRNSRRGGDRK